MQPSPPAPTLSPAPPIDRARLREDLRQVARTIATIGAERLLKFLKEQEFELPVPSLLVRQGLRSLLQSKADKLCELSDGDLRNLLRLVDWHAKLALGEVSPDLLPMAPAKHPAVKASIQRAMTLLLADDWEFDPEAPEPAD